MLDVVLLSRLQFALTIMFHYLFPPLTIGLALVITYLLAMHLRTREAIYDVAARFWTGIFAVNFALGVATGIVMEFQFGTNWARYSRYVGDVFGSALAAEGIFAFFLESGFLAVLLFGWERVSRRFLFFSSLMVLLGSIFSSVWITVANSWQQTPAGFALRTHEVAGRTFERAEITDFWAMVFNPSAVDRLLHVWGGCFVLGAFFAMSVSAFYLLRGRHLEFAQRSFKGALLLGTIFSLAQLVSGDMSARGVARNQPAKLAAFEGLYETQTHAPLHLFGWPDEEERVRFGLAIPGALSFLVHRDPAGEVKGLRELGPLYGVPPVWLSFQAFHLMVAIGLLFIAATLVACFFWWRGTLFAQRWLLWFFVFAVGPAFVANEIGWVAAEVGRQPWVVYPTLVDGLPVGGLRTDDGVSESVGVVEVLISIGMFGVIYVLLFGVWVFVLDRKIRTGPAEIPAEPKGTRPRDFLDVAAERVAKRPSSP